MKACTSILALFAVGAGFGSSPVASQQTFIVDSMGDGGDSSPGNGVCDDGSGNCTLRAAIEESNALAGADAIHFAIPGAGPHTIQPLSGLPGITDPVTIDAYTQPGASPNTNGPSVGSNAVLMIELDGSLAGIASGLDVNSGSGTSVRGLVINRFNVGIGLNSSNTSNNVIEGNFIGTDITGVVDLGNAAHGLSVSSPDNTIGGTTPAARNLVSGNGNAGMRITGSRNVIQGNLIGTDVTGTLPMGNGSGGFQIVGFDNTIGGTTPAARNVISGNSAVGAGGVGIGQGAKRTVVQGNFIGTDVSGTAPLPNTQGVHMNQTSNNTIGGTTPGSGNVISGNSGGGVVIATNGTGNLIAGNFVGTDPTGMFAVPNLNGVSVGGTDTMNNTIGGTTPAARNVVSGNTGNGVSVGGLNVVVQGNYIGTDVTGTIALGNDIGVNLSDDAVVGGPTAAERNVVSGNRIGFWFRNTDRAVAEGNFIGTDAAGTGPLPNATGMEFQRSKDNRVASNRIAYNTAEGMILKEAGATTARNTITQNAIFANGSLGIDLTAGGLPDGPTPNDLDDVDAGPNNTQNYPVLTSATTTTVDGTLDSAPSTTFTVELFASTACDPSGFGEGEIFLGSASVTTDSTGDASFTASLATPASTGQFVTATATDPDGNTSEFSACLEIVVLLVNIDIKPGSFPNSINLGSKGVTPVAILSSASFDATQVDPLTVTLAEAGVRVKGNGTPQASLQDVDGDGRLDLVAHMETEAFQLTSADVEATLDGLLLDATPIQGTDSVRIVP